MLATEASFEVKSKFWGARNKVKAASIGDLVCNSAEDLLEKCDVIFYLYQT